ncbi:uroporphyrinogen-III C-methyltransferase [Xenorhabdus griffiniae]|uniref:uroporphyrinogen-III C-methyltransferase n=1 Tax=Xenorhabdus griffiniae TaxID=351672 RepID=A0ABY9XKE8_9GAMM|nr:uroporphyrinogen-III C-methyltransferase [Xenorhabdus griffiniae]MBD1228040.1 uroporphyrinogen-III C-methyltransferase [Xenorhabdus griffiniae]MBE8589236.1 uroporphyrinogen-III C-methyltransferase [Xenorhabdus griffiniae]WMV73362.1 uroporphyrinogen-III C-methyltransferase [Xenorhabdus griffiniae]WNH03041.1 uroporphyrinogen-III C-methyltransferase [Xenorhabdus griffiniae]
MNKGNVWLVGAGPGDAGLITVKGLRCIQSADVIVHDRLVNPELIAQVSDHCEIINVGKEHDYHPIPQDEINQILVRHAQAGKRVVRLKGGDPYVFGRGGEEAEVLAQHGIKFEVIPGISSSIGGLTYAGIPITHRNYASSFHVVTGHTSQGNEQQNWEILAQLEGTLVILMGMSRLMEICQQLMLYGKSPTTPAAVIMYASHPKQESVTGTLETLAAKAEAKHLHAPALIVVGDVVNLGAMLSFPPTYGAIP